MINASNCLRPLVCFIALLAVTSMTAQANHVISRHRFFAIVDRTNACSQGETIALNLAFPAGLVQAPAGTSPATVSAFARILDLNGRVLFTGHNETITIDGRHTESVSRRQLDVPPTGPLTLLAEWVISAPGDFGPDLPASAEVVDGCSGRVLYHAGQGLTLQYRPVPGANELVIALHFAPLSLAYGQTVRLNIGQQWVFGVELPTTASAHFRSVSGLGAETEVTESRNFRLGETLTFEVNRSQLSAAGDPGTGRLTVRLVVQYRARLSRVQLTQLWRQGALPQFPASLQLVDDNNPSAIGLLLPAVQKIREAACPARGC